MRIKEQDVNDALFDYISAPNADARDRAFRTYERTVDELKELDAGKANVHLPNLQEINLNGQTFVAPTRDDQTTKTMFEKRLNNFDETISLTDVDRAFVAGLLTVNTYKEFSQRVNENLDQSFKDMLLDARTILKLPPPNMLISSNAENIDRLNKLSEFDTLARANRRELKENFNARTFFEENKGMLEEDTNNIDDVQARIENTKLRYSTKELLEAAINTAEAANKPHLQELLQFMINNGGYD